MNWIQVAFGIYKLVKKVRKKVPRWVEDSMKITDPKERRRVVKDLLKDKLDLTENEARLAVELGVLIYKRKKGLK